jgi:hypothetical protein
MIASISKLGSVLVLKFEKYMVSFYAKAKGDNCKALEIKVNKTG